MRQQPEPDDATAADDTAPDATAADAAATDDKATDDKAADSATTSAPARRRPHRRPLLAGRHASSAVIGVLTLLLGFGIAVQVHANSGPDALSGLREDDLIGILDNQDARSERLRQQIAQAQGDLTQLQNSGDRAAAARQQAADQRTALGILLGTLPTAGPGITVTITDPEHKLGGEDLLDVVQELRGAGAEAIQFGSVRVSTPTAFTGAAGSPVAVDGTTLTAPYTVLAIGDAKTLDTALNIPGGVAASVRTAGGELTVVEHRTVRIHALRALTTPKYAKPAH